MNTREKIIRASYKARACHIGSALSCVEIIESIAEVMGDDDIFLFAKASGVAALYAYMFDDVDMIAKYLKKYPLPNRKVPGVVWTGGSLGQGLSVAVGIALAKKLNKEKGKVYCLISDGELQEGQTWEAIMFAQTFLNNLSFIIDYNGLQSLGNLLFSLRILRDSIDGHDKVIIKKLLKLDGFNIIAAKTVKGKGVDFAENNNDWHYKNLDETRFEEALLQVVDKKGE